MGQCSYLSPYPIQQPDNIRVIANFDNQSAGMGNNASCYIDQMEPYAFHSPIGQELR